MGNWNDLSIRERADLIRMYMDGGVMSVSQMREHYNSFDKGGYKPSQSIKDYIKKTEAFRSNWYLDGNGVPTVGYGFTGKYYKEKYPDGMTKEQADKEFDRVLDKFAGMVKTHTPNYDSLSQNQKDALLSYMYNVGPGNYTKRSPKFQQALRDKDWNAAASHMDIGYNDKRNPGLRKRRDYERGLFLNSTSPSSPYSSASFPNYYEETKSNVQFSLDPAAYSTPKVGMPSLYYAQSSPYKDVDFSSPLPEFNYSPQGIQQSYQPRKRGKGVIAYNDYASQIPSNEDIIDDLYLRLGNMENVFVGGGKEKKWNPRPLRGRPEAPLGKYDTNDNSIVGPEEPVAWVEDVTDIENPYVVMDLKRKRRKDIRKIAEEDALTNTEKPVLSGRASKRRLYNRVYDDTVKQVREQEERKALKRAAVEELQTGVPTGAFEEYTRKGREDVAPYAFGLVSAGAAPWLSEALPTAAKAIDLAGRYAMPSTFLKGVESYLPWAAKGLAEAAPIADAAALSYWSALAGKEGYNAAKEGKIGDAIGYGALAALPLAPIAAGKLIKGKGRRVKGNEREGIEAIEDDIFSNGIENPTEEDFAGWREASERDRRRMRNLSESEMREAVNELLDDSLLYYNEPQEHEYPPMDIDLNPYEEELLFAEAYTPDTPNIRSQEASSLREMPRQRESSEDNVIARINSDGSFETIEPSEVRVREPQTQESTQLDFSSMSDSDLLRYSPTTMQDSDARARELLSRLQERVNSGLNSFEDIEQAERISNGFYTPELESQIQRQTYALISDHIKKNIDDIPYKYTWQKRQAAIDLYNNNEISKDNKYLKSLFEEEEQTAKSFPIETLITHGRLFGTGADRSKEALMKLHSKYGRQRKLSDAEIKEKIGAAAKALNIDLETMSESDMNDIIRRASSGWLENNDRELLSIIDNLKSLKKMMKNPSSLSEEEAARLKGIFRDSERQYSLDDIEDIENIVNSAYHYKSPTAFSKFDADVTEMYKNELFKRLREVAPEGTNVEAILDPRHPDYRKIAAFVRDNYSQILPADIEHLYWFQADVGGLPLPMPKDGDPVKSLLAYLGNMRRSALMSQGQTEAGLQSRMLQIGMPSETAIAEQSTSANSLRSQIAGALANPEGYGIEEGQTTIEKLRASGRSTGNNAHLNRVYLDENGMLKTTANIPEIDNMKIRRGDIEALKYKFGVGNINMLRENIINASQEEKELLEKLITVKDIMSGIDARNVNSKLKLANKRNALLGLETIEDASAYNKIKHIDDPDFLSDENLVNLARIFGNEMFTVLGGRPTAFILERTPIITRKHKYGGTIN